MVQRRVPVQVNQFVGGLVSDLNPLIAEATTSRDEQNMEIAQDGSRVKRLGFRYESGHTKIQTQAVTSLNKNEAVKLFKWDNAGGDAFQSILCAQVGNTVHFFDLSAPPPITSNLISSVTLGSYDQEFSFASVDSFLVVATGEKDIVVFNYDGSSITQESQTLQIRDFFGVEDIVDGVDLNASTNLGIRPTTLTDAHLYNLRNQTFAFPKPWNNEETLYDPIEAFYLENGPSGKYGSATTPIEDYKWPSNSDSINPYLYANPNDSDDRLIERFWARHLFANRTFNASAAKGFFIIDALERGDSREEEAAKLFANNPELIYPITNLGRDKTPGGAKVLEEFAGRVWYAGFSGEVISGDSKSPKMSSYLLFSQLVQNSSDISRCFQVADPTSHIDSALVDTDGGFIRIEGAYGINKLINLEGSLFVFAVNGVWRISGSEEEIFKATSYQVSKLTEKGCVGGGSVVQVDKSVIFWGEDSIYTITRNEFGSWEVIDIGEGRIKTRYLNLSTTQKQKVSGVYDGYESQVRWVCTGSVNNAEYSEEYILNIKSGSFTYNRTPVVANNLPLIKAIGITNPYLVNRQSENVTENGIVVTVNSEAVTTPINVVDPSLKEIIYIAITDTTTFLTFTLGTYSSNTFLDWTDEGSGVGYESFLITNFLTSGEPRTRKEAKYLTVFFKKTEGGFDVDFNPLNPSSCLISAMWDWHGTTTGQKWSDPRQAYRLKRPYFPANANDTYDTGETVISTRNKIRGFGKSFAFRFEGEYGKDLRIYGWSFDLLAAADE